MSPSAQPAAYADVAMRRDHRRLVALLGCETRYIAISYLQQIFLLTVVAEAVVLSFDVATNFNWVSGGTDNVHGLVGVAKIAYYALLRGGYVLASVLPISTFVGILWAEFSLSGRNERIMIFNSGRAPFYSLVPALLVGLVMGGMQFMAESYARPISAELQSLSGFRDYGPKFRPTDMTGPKWIAAGDTVVNGRVDFRRGATMHDVVIYRINDMGQLETLFSAEAAAPRAGTEAWTITNGTRWDFTTNDAGLRMKVTEDGQSFSTLDIALPLHPLWLRNIEIRPSLLRQSDLADLAADPKRAPNSHRYATAYEMRSAGVARMIGLSVLATSLSLLLIATGQSLVAALKIGAVGYAAMAFSVTFEQLGDTATVNVMTAAWALPVLLVTASIAIVGWLAGKGRAAYR